MLVYSNWLYVNNNYYALFVLQLKVNTLAYVYYEDMIKFPSRLLVIASLHMQMTLIQHCWFLILGE